MTIEIAGRVITSSWGIAASVAAVLALLSAVFAWHRSTRCIHRDALVNDPEFQRIIADGDLPARILDRAGKQWRRISWMLALTGFLLMACAFGLG
jgi:hypothetical protein